MNFTKMNGIGNDYIYFNCINEELKDPEKVSIILSDRHFGVGGDGIVLILKSEISDFKMRIFNADGSEAKMCGNGIRCVGKYVYEKGLTKKDFIKIDTLSGVKLLKLTIENDEVVSIGVNMGEAILNSREIPVLHSQENIINEKITIDEIDYYITCISMGNPHCVVFIDDIDNLDLKTIGPKFENHSMFPDRINTEFVEIIDENTVKMRVWERGSDETLACGTGACAVVVASVLNNYCKKDNDITVKLLGGDLTIKYQSDGLVYMTGTADFVFDGTYINKNLDI
ncbi:diaminopimelate epimerase [Clostridium gasigenes]|uniref:Diaminopimelate epimerase n=1 Tax=Clostridium gasigenes TaxID=94869 RepID=A0A1H0RJX3_9CLOT|nr:diaminopimelate epimerase [Clostridium gasigenes]MBB6715231.1 diaminopimelate epimerase [Clostridium gasigenes]SDP29296.1 diaminopimelate epimerase [Clostridium gasigenes]